MSGARRFALSLSKRWDHRQNVPGSPNHEPYSTHEKLSFSPASEKAPFPLAAEGLTPSLIVQVFLEEKPFSPQRSCGRSHRLSLQAATAAHGKTRLQPEVIVGCMEAAHSPPQATHSRDTKFPTLALGLRYCSRSALLVGHVNLTPACSYVHQRYGAVPEPSRQ